jgi:hypothetical protein
MNTIILHLDAAAHGNRVKTALDNNAEGVEDITSPNRLLMNMFLDQLRNVHDREMHLTGSECQQLMHLIQHRERNIELHPLPFMPPQDDLVEAEMLDGHKPGIARSESTLSVATSVSIGSAFTTNSNITAQSQKTAQNVANHTQNSGKLINLTAGRLSRVTSPLLGLKDSDEKQVDGKAAHTYDFLKNNEAFLEDDNAGVPHWSCFIKSVSSSQILLCFTPSSFDDLEMLTKGHKTEVPLKSERKDVEEKPEASIERRESTSTNTGDSSATLDTLVGSSSYSSVLEEKTSPSAPAASSTPHTTSPKEQPEPRSVHLPVYVYNCPLSYLSDQIVNRWTLKKLTDLFEDMRFPVEEEDVNASSEREKKLSDSDRWRAAGEAENIYEDEEDLKHHCTLLSETYLRCFVNCKFNNLLL